MIPFEIPERWVGEVASGAMRRVGVNLVDTTSGLIRGHVQEGAGFPQIPLPTGIPGSPVSLVMSGVRAGSSLAQNVQLEQIKSMMSTLQMLSGATLAASVVGVGVSAAGFIVMSRKLDAISGQLAGMEKTLLETKLDVKQIKAVVDAEARGELTAALSEAEEAWDHSDPSRIWQPLTSRLNTREHVYRAFLAPTGAKPHAFLDPNLPLGACIEAYESALLLSSTRFKMLMSLDELAAAATYAGEVYKWNDRLFRGISPDQVAEAKAGVEAGRSGTREDVQKSRLRADMSDFFDGERELEVLLSTRADLVQTMRSREFSGREFVERVREETEAPVLVFAR